MISVAFTDTNGNIQNIMSPGSDSDYIDGEIYGNQVARHLPSDIDWGIAMEQLVYKDGGWMMRPPKPGFYYKWISDAWVKDTETLLSAIKGERNIRLGMSDWTQVADSPLSEEVKASWRVYRQALRDLPDILDMAVIEDPGQVTWPTPPA